MSRAAFAPLVMALTLMACAGERLDDGDPASLDLPAELAPGTAVSRGGLMVGATDKALTDPVRVDAVQVAMPEGLPGEVLAHGPPWQVSAERRVIAPEDAAFVVALPLDGVPRDRWGQLGVAVHEPADDLHFELRCEDTCDGRAPEHVWTLLPAAVDPERERVIALLPQLTPDGRTLAVVSGPELASPPLSTDEPGGRAGGLSVAVRCLGFQGRCDPAAARAVSAGLTRTLGFLTETGFPEPYLQRRHVEAARVSPPVAPVAPRFLVNVQPIRRSAGERLGVCERADDAENVAVYSAGTRSLTVCLGPDGVTPEVAAAARHAVFHAVQYAYRPVREEPREGWIMEGTAAAMEQAGQMLERADDVDPRAVDVALDRADPDASRGAQDFWVYLGQRSGRGLAWLTLVFRRGANRDAVDDALAMDVPGTGGLGAAYAQWARNQAYEKTLDLEGALGDQCAVNLDTVDVVRHVHHPHAPLPEIDVVTRPLQSTMHVIDLLGLPFTSYQAAITVRGEPDADVRIYDGVDEYCLDEAESLTRRFVIPPRGVQMVYVLVSNDGLERPASARIAVR